MVVDDRVIVENKATELLSPAAKPQLITYLRATAFEAGVLLHFGPRPRFYRLIDSPKRPFVPIRAASSNSCPARRALCQGQLRRRKPHGETRTLAENALHRDVAAHH